MPGITLLLIVTLSRAGPDFVLDREASEDLSILGHEVLQIKKEYRGKIWIMVHSSAAFKQGMDSQSIWQDGVRLQDPPCRFSAIILLMDPYCPTRTGH